MSVFKQPRVRDVTATLLHGERFCRVMGLYSKNSIPASIETWMVIQPLTSLLKAIYGSGTRAVYYLSAYYLSSWWSWTKNITIPRWWHFNILRRTEQEWQDKCFAEEEENGPSS